MKHHPGRRVRVINPALASHGRCGVVSRVAGGLVFVELDPPPPEPPVWVYFAAELGTAPPELPTGDNPFIDSLSLK